MDYVSQDPVQDPQDPPGTVTVLDGQTIPPVIGHPFGVGVNRIAFPVQPLYDMRLAADLIPTTYSNLAQFLKRHRQHFLSRYRIDANRRRIRLLSASEIAFIRSRMLRGPGKATYDPVNVEQP